MFDLIIIIINIVYCLGFLCALIGVYKLIISKRYSYKGNEEEEKAQLIICIGIDICTVGVIIFLLLVFIK